MFDRAGEKLKNVARIFLGLYGVLMAIVFIYVLILIVNEDIGGEGLVIFLVIGGISFVSTYIQCLMFYGFGEVVDDVERMSDKIVNVSGNMKTDKKDIDFVIPLSETNKKPSPTQWQCRRCGNINQNYVGTCSCGNTQRENNY